MGFLYFMGIVVVGLACLLIFIRLTTRRLTGPITPVVRVASANGQAEAMTYKGALAAAGIWYEVREERADAYIGDTLASFEIWVREKDLDEARSALGL